jgi:alpha-D-xyloside xylohydrolase
VGGATELRVTTAVALTLGLVSSGVAAPAAADHARQAASHCGDPAVAKASGALRAPARDFADINRDGTRVTTRSGRIRLEVALEPLTITVSTRRDAVVREVPAGGLSFKRGEGSAPIPVTNAEATGLERCALRLRAAFADGTTGAVTLQAHADDTMSVALAFDDATITHWGERLSTSPDERVYGLTERIVDDFGASELTPQAVGTLNRKGERVTMYVRPTISAYAPFYQSSNGYGLLVDGTMPGVYDLGAADPAVLSFEYEIDPQAHAGRYFVFAGDHYAQSDAYSRLTGRPFVPPKDVFLHWRGRDQAVLGAPVDVDGVPVNPIVADDLLNYERYDIPVGIYHFDRPWAEGTEGYGTLRFDPARFPDADAMLEMMKRRGWASQVWVSEWALDERATRARERGWLAPGSERELDLTNPAAVRALERDLRGFLEGPGRLVDGFFVDRSEEIVPSDPDDVYHDGRNGRQIHNAYPVLLQRTVRRALNEARGRDGWAIARAAYTGTAGYAMTWGGDTHSREGVLIPEQPDTGPSTDLGLRSVLVSLQRSAFMGLPYWGSDIGGYSDFADREVFARWIEVSALSPLMRFHGKGTDAPWDMPTEPKVDQEMIDIYRRYVVLHHALAGYQQRLARDAHRTGAPLARPLVFNYPDDPNVADRWDQWLLGDDLLVAPVWQSGGRSRAVYLPKGKWVDFWDRSRVVEGPVELTEDVPLGKIPLFVKQGSPLLRDQKLEEVVSQR